MYARDGNSIVPCIQKILKNVSTHNIFDFPVNIIRLGNYKFCIRARLSIVPNFMHFFFLSSSFLAAATRKYWIGKLTVPIQFYFSFK